MTNSEKKVPSAEKKPPKKPVSKTLIGILCAVAVAIAGIIAGAVTLFSGVPVTIIADYQDETGSGVIQLPTVTELNDNTAMALVNALIDITSIGPSTSPEDDTTTVTDACSALFVPLSSASGNITLLGRNMDYEQTPYPAWIFYIDAPDRYRSFNMGYLGSDVNVNGIEIIPPMSDITKTGTIPRYLYRILPYIITDAVNDQGLVIEVNARGECNELTCYGTNTASNTRVCSALLARYLIDRCATISEALELIEKLNIYSLHSSIMSQSYAMGMMDATGRHGVLEFAQDRVIWHENQSCHTNFWIDETAAKISGVSNGLGRWNALQNASPTITSYADLQNALRLCYDRQKYTKTTENSTFDVVYDISKNMTALLEDLDTLAAAGQITMDKTERETIGKILARLPQMVDNHYMASNLADPQIKANISRCYDFIVRGYEQMPASYLMNKNLLYVSVFSYLTSSAEPVLQVRFFEHDDVHTFGFPNS